MNTPDILHAFIQTGNRAAFAIRATLAATLSPLWGMYSGFELYEHEPVAPGSEEYLNSEKYELRPRDFGSALHNGDSLEPYITMLNTIRREHPAFQQLRNLHFHDTDNESILAFSKFDAATGDSVLVVVNLDPTYTQEATVTLNMGALGLAPGASFPVHDEITGADYEWSMRNYVRLSPVENVAHIFRLPLIDEPTRTKLAFRNLPDDDYRP